MTTPQEHALVELSQWLARLMQYSPSHPACVVHAERTVTAVRAAHEVEAPLTYGVLRDDVTSADVPLKHAAIRTRLGPAMHARGILVLRISPGATEQDLGALVEVLAMPAQSVFDQGGVKGLLAERGTAKVQVDEIAHDVTAEEMEARRRRQKLADFFKEMLRNMLARRQLPAFAEHLAELLAHPEIAVAILEADAAGIAEAAAGLVLMVRQHQARTGEDLMPGALNVLVALSARSRDKLLLGVPSLVGEFREAILAAFAEMSDPQLARMVFPSVRSHAADMDATLYALAVAVPHEGTRYSVLRGMSLHLYDLPPDEPEDAAVIEALSRDVAPHDSNRRELEILCDAARGAMRQRFELGARPPPSELAPFDAERPLTELVMMTVNTASFERFCEWLPGLAPAQNADGVIGILRGLGSAGGTRAAVAAEAARKIALAVADRVLVELDGRSEHAEGEQLEKIASTVRLLAVHATPASVAHLDVSSNRKMRRLLLDALPAAGPPLLPLAVERLRSPSWFVVRNAAMLVARAHGAATDLAQAARHPNEKVRVEVLRALRSMPADEAMMDIAATALTDAVDEVRAAARVLLRGELLGASAVASLERIAADEHQKEEMRLTAVQLLGRCPRDDAAAALSRVLQPKSFIEMGASTVRDAAAVALRSCPAPSAAELFQQGLRSSTWRVRKACERAEGSS